MVHKIEGLTETPAALQSLLSKNFISYFSVKAFLKQRFMRQESWKTKAFFSTHFYFNIKIKNFHFTTSVSLLHLKSAACLR